MPADVADDDAPSWFRANLAVTPDEGHTTVEGCTVRWLRWGDPARPPLVLVHGGAAHARWWAPLAPFLTDEWCVIAPELTGHGDSDWRPAYRSETWAAEVLAVAAAAAGAGTPPPVLVGHSLGATVVGTAAALAGDGVRAVVLCDIGVRARDERSRSGRHFQNRRTYATRDEAVSRFKLIPRQPCDNPWMVRHIAETSVRPVGPGGADDPTRPAEGAVTGWAWKFDWRLFARTWDRWFGDYLAEITAPVAAIHGEKSRVVPPYVAQRVRDALREPPFEVWVPEARHHLMADQPIAFVAALRAALTHTTGALRPLERDVAPDASVRS